MSKNEKATRKEIAENIRRILKRNPQIGDYAGKLIGIDIALSTMDSCCLDYQIGQEPNYQRIKDEMLNARGVIKFSQRNHNSPGAYCRQGLSEKPGREENQDALKKAISFYNAIVEQLNSDSEFIRAIGELEKIE